jgi:hypothetical protein
MGVRRIKRTSLNSESFYFWEDLVMKRTKFVMFCALTLLFCNAQAMMGVAKACTCDNCSNPTLVGEVTDMAFDTTDATFDGPGLCMTSPNIWFLYTPSCSGVATVSLCGSSYDTKLAVYEGSDCDLKEEDLIKCNDDYCDRQSRLSFGAVAGQQYLIEVGGYHDETGVGVLTIICEPATCPPTNDDCWNAITIGEVSEKVFDTRCATFDGPGLCMTSPNIWYLYTPSCTGTATISLCGTNFDTMLAAYDWDGCPVAERDFIDCNDDYCYYASQLKIDVIAGADYLIEIGGYDEDDTGQGVLTITCEATSGPELENDDCSKAKPVGDVTDLAFDTTNATFDGPGVYLTSPNIWYCYTASCTGTATVSLCGSSYDTKLAVYDGCQCYPTSARLIGANDDYCGRSSQINLDVTAGSQYLIEVGGYRQNVGQGVLSISCEGIPGPQVPNDDCSKATVVGDVTNLAFDTTEATFDGPGACMTSPNIWYCYTATCTGTATISLCGSSYDTKLGIYEGCQCNATSSRLIECNDDYCGRSSQITLDVTAGSQYLIEVGGYRQQTGQGVLSISCEGQALAELDFGDAPDSTNNYGRTMTTYSSVQANFPTIFNDGGSGPFGPFHRRALEVAHLGKTVTLEAEADIGADEDVVNNIDPPSNSADKDGADDGVTVPLSMPACGWTAFDYQVNVIDPSINLWVNVWFDWNRDGDWDDDSNTDPTLSCSKDAIISEWAVQNQYLFNLPVGLNLLTTPGFMAYNPEGGKSEIWMRITLSEQPWTGGETPDKVGNGGSGPQAGYTYGETEDYLFTPVISEDDGDCTLCEDLNGDGQINYQDLSILVNDWISKCM